MHVGRWVVAGTIGLLLGGGLPARADVSSDKPAAIVMFPKLLADTSTGVDTLVRLSNTSGTPLTLHCFLVDATPRCANGTGTCLPNSNAPQCLGSTANAECVDSWTETDFRLVLTQQQPIGWRISQGMRDCRTTTDPLQPCFQLDGITRIGPGGQSNVGSNILPAPHDQFVGYLECIAVDDNDAPVERNDVKGEALIVRYDPGKAVDVDGYNAVGLQAITPVNKSEPTPILCLGGCDPSDPTCQRNDLCPNGPEYDGCANILILDHFFDGAVDPVTNTSVVTDLTLVPCSQDYLRQSPQKTPVQFLVFNEFEQRFSTSIPVTCFKEIQLSNIDTLTNDRSIFSAAVNGTLTGQTRIRGVADDDSTHGHAMVGIARELRCQRGGDLGQCSVISTSAFNLHSQGRRPQADIIYLPPS
jgi:hypothetical protein